MAIRFLDVRTNIFQSLAFVHNLHHVTRDANADFSADAHGVKFRLIRRRIVFDIAGSVTRMPVVDTAAVTRNVAERFSIEHGETVSITSYGITIAELFRQDRARCKFISMWRGGKCGAGNGGGGNEAQAC